jgi:hypothetical protein
MGLYKLPDDLIRIIYEYDDTYTPSDILQIMHK